MIKEKYDSIVAGAGPAGSIAAKIMAESGMDVLLIDKKSEIGHVKRCGEGLSENHLKLAGIEPNPLWIRREIDGALIFSPNGTKVVMDTRERKSYVIERKVFDKFLAMDAAKAGAYVQAGMNALDLIEEGKITGIVAEYQGKKYNIKADLVVAADGIDSVLARKAGINTTLKLDDLDSCAEFEMSGISMEDSNKIMLYFGNEIAPGGYAWVFPKGEDTANVGLGIRASMASNAFDYLQRFVKKMGFDNGSVIEVNIGGVPVGGNMNEFVRDGFMVVGDAARQVNPIHGGGIGIAMASAKILAETAVKSYNEKNYSKEFLSEYEKRWREQFDKKMSKLLKLRRFAEKLSDDQLNEIASMVSGVDLYELSQGKFKSFIKLMSRSPGIVKYLPLLLRT
jgi:digeranylgeranylglycerophospholipid reductase